MTYFGVACPSLFRRRVSFLGTARSKLLCCFAGPLSRWFAGSLLCCFAGARLNITVGCLGHGPNNLYLRESWRYYAGSQGPDPANSKLIALNSATLRLLGRDYAGLQRPDPANTD